MTTVVIAAKFLKQYVLNIIRCESCWQTVDETLD